MTSKKSKKMRKRSTATFRDEPAGPSGQKNWNRIAELVAIGRTVEVYRRKIGNDYRLFLRIWRGKRADDSNKVYADPDKQY